MTIIVRHYYHSLHHLFFHFRQDEHFFGKVIKQYGVLMNPKKYLSYTALLVILFQLNTFGQAHLNSSGSMEGSFAITGIIVDSASTLPLSGVTVVLLIENGSDAITSLTSASGNFSITVPSKREYILHLSYSGYKTHQLRINPTPNDSLINLGVIRLQKEDILLSEVVVTSRKPLIKNEADKLVYNASADISNVSGSAADVLRKVPMVTVDADGAVKMRGSSNIKVLLNGFPSGILAQNLKEALKMIPANTIESIEVITSPSAKYEAEGAAGIINIITKKLKGNNGNVSIDGGNLQQSASGSLNFARGKFTHSFSLYGDRTIMKTYNELKRESFNNGSMVGNLFQRSDGRQKSTGGYGSFTSEYRPDSLQTLSAEASFWHGSWPVESQLYSLYESNSNPLEYYQTSEQGGNFNYFDLSLNYLKKFSRKSQELKVVAQADHSNSSMDYVTNQQDISGFRFFKEQSPNRSKDGSFNLQTDYTHPLNRSSKNLVETGMRYSRTSSSSAYSVLNNRATPGSEELAKDFSRSDTMSYYQNIFAAYLSLTFRFKGEWEIKPGVRYEATRLGGEFTGPTPGFKASFVNFVPNVLLSRKINSHHNAKISYTERIRRPWIWDLNPYVNASDPLNLTFGNPKLRPEVTRTLEVGHGYSSASGFSLNSSIYFGLNNNAVESLTTVDSLGVSRTTSRNIASNRRIGGNINSYISITPKWTLNSSVSFSHVTFRSCALNSYNKGNIFSINLTSSYNLPSDYSIEISGNYDNGFLSLQGNTSANYSYRFTARKDIMKKKASITVGLNNIFQPWLEQRSYVSASNFNSSNYSRQYNRSFSIAFNWRFGALRQSQYDGDYNENQNGGGMGFPSGRGRSK